MPCVACQPYIHLPKGVVVWTMVEKQIRCCASFSALSRAYWKAAGGVVMWLKEQNKILNQIKGEKEKVAN